MAAKKRKKKSSAKRKPMRRAKAARRAKPARARRAAPQRRASARPAAAPARYPSGIGFMSQHLDYTSHAMEDVRRFYGELLGFSKSNYDAKFNYFYVDTGPTSSLGFMPPMPGPPEQWRPPREPAIYLHVRDVDRVYRDLKAKGVTFQQEPRDMPWKHRVAVLRDPEGRMVMLAQLSPG